MVNKPPPVSILPPRMPIIFDVSAVFQSEYRHRRRSSYFRRPVSVVSGPVFFIYIIIVMTRRRWPSGRVSNYYYSSYYYGGGGALYVTINYTPLYYFCSIHLFYSTLACPSSTYYSTRYRFFLVLTRTVYLSFSLSFFPTRYRFIKYVHLLL